MTGFRLLGLQSSLRTVRSLRLHTGTLSHCLVYITLISVWQINPNFVDRIIRSHWEVVRCQFLIELQTCFPILIPRLQTKEWNAVFVWEFLNRGAAAMCLLWQTEPSQTWWWGARGRSWGVAASNQGSSSKLVVTSPDKVPLSPRALNTFTRCLLKLMSNFASILICCSWINYYECHVRPCFTLCVDQWEDLPVIISFLECKVSPEQRYFSSCGCSGGP